MEAEAMSREQFFGMAGIGAVDEQYTPVSIGKSNKIRNGNRSWIASLSKANFHNADELKALTPENVSEKPIFYMGADGMYSQVLGKKAIVGDVSGKAYEVHSNKYQVVQHSLLSNSVAQASVDSGIPVFGKLNDEGSRMSINAFFADPDCNIDFGGIGQKDPYMLGVRAYNAHDGTRGFGAEIIGVRAICQNMTGFGQILGSVKWKHFVAQEKVTDLISGMIQGYMDKVPVLKKRIEAMKSEELTLDEVECAYWGIKVQPHNIESIMGNLDGLVPEIKHKNGKVSLYDAFNGLTAYNSYSNSGRGDFARASIMNLGQSFIVEPIDRIIDEGHAKREDFIQKLNEKVMNASNTVLVDY